VLHFIRIAAGRLARQLFPATGARRQRASVARHVQRPSPYRPLRRPDPSAWYDAGPLVRPYILDAEERVRRRREGLPQAVSTAP
jgi:hypothetical protein